tara:strand:+ start:555 stop:1814 length:1260 start_codon:yes stop_codon:yes gene_type:complete
MRWPLMGETITIGDRLSMAYFAMTAKKFTNGDKVKQFESDWNDWLGSKYSLFVSSGSTANLLLVAAVKEMYNLKNGDKVLVPACTWVTNVAPIIQLGLKPIFCDINLKDFSFDLYQVKAIAKQHDIKMVFTTHLLGFPVRVSNIKRILPKAIYIDDVCESHGATINNTKVGSNSLGATFSFYFGHHMSTIEGGMVSTNNKDLYDLMKMKRSHGMARESLYFSKHAQRWNKIDKQFLFMTDGYNFRNHEISAVLGIRQLRRLSDMVERRKINHTIFCNMLTSYKDIFYPIHDNLGNSSFCLPFVCKERQTMIDLKKLFKDNNIEYRPIVSGNLLRQPFLKDYKMSGVRRVSKMSNVDILHNNGVYIGNNHFVDYKYFEKLNSLLKEFYDSRKTRRDNQKSNKSNSIRVRAKPNKQNSRPS